VRSSWRSSITLGLAATLVAGAALHAHRLDEYLQAARISVGPDRARVELELTAGTAVADAVLADLDRDRSGTISTQEAAAYAADVRDAVTVEIDGARVAVDVVDTRMPEIEAVRRGEGAMHIDLAAMLPPLRPGTHHLLYRNGHRPEISVYLANALVPDSDRVTIAAQRRDVDQHQVVVDYVLDANRTTGMRIWFGISIAVVLLAAGSLWRRTRFTPRSAPSCHR
jgi:hypothetical protein